MKRIAIYIDSDFQGTGVSQYIKALLNALIALSQNNFTVTIIYTRKSWETHCNNSPNIKSIFFNNRNLTNRLYQLFISMGFQILVKQIACKFDKKVKFINNQGFDYVIFPSGDTLACLVNCKVIGTIHDLMHRYERHFKESGSFLRYKYRDNYYKNLLKSATAVLVDSNLGKQQVIDSYRDIKLEILVLPYIAPDYIYSQNYTNLTQKNDSILNTRYLFYAAAFHPHKNHLNLLKAIKLLKERGQLIDLLLAGKKNLEYKKLQKFVNINNLEKQVKFLGYIADAEMVNLYKNAFAMVMPTFYGPTNIPPIEAILLNCPPIVSNKYAMPEQFENAAIYFDPHSSLQIADSIESLLTDNNLRNNLIKNGEKIREKFSQKRFESDLKNNLKYLD